MFDFYAFFEQTYFQSKIKICCFSMQKNLFFEKSGSKCIRNQVKLILNTFMLQLTFFMIWWQQAHFFMIFQFFSTLRNIALEVILCIINAYWCAFCASICIVVSFYNNFWYVHNRHSFLMIYEILEFFQKNFIFGKIEKKIFAPRIKLMSIIYKILLQNFSLALVLLVCDEILIYQII